MAVDSGIPGPQPQRIRKPKKMANIVTAGCLLALVFWQAIKTSIWKTTRTFVEWPDVATATLFASPMMEMQHFEWLTRVVLGQNLWWVLALTAASGMWVIGTIRLR